MRVRGACTRLVVHLNIVGGQIGGACREAMQSGGHPDVHCSEASSGNGNDIEQTEVTEGRDECHQQ